MSHSVRINNYVKTSEKPSIDPLCKIFIVIQWLLGINRMRVLTANRIMNTFAFLYDLFFIWIVIFAIYTYSHQHREVEAVEYVKLFQYIMCGIFGFFSRKKVQLYYKELNKFDSDVGCRPKVTREPVLILLSMVVTCCTTGSLFCRSDLIQFMPLHIIHTIENHYYALLINLLNQRLRLINHCVESSLYTNPIATNKQTKAFVFYNNDNKMIKTSMNKLMDFYYIIINAYDLLTGAIKWQLLFIITTSFIYTLSISYHIALGMISGDGHVVFSSWIKEVILVASEALPLAAPCLCCDLVRHEVRRLRELLASKLFESKLDKFDRNVARALLALTKARNLSFSLLRMVDISISLPFSFIGLLATYLIILLQFEKVINPNAHTFVTTISP